MLIQFGKTQCKIPVTLLAYTNHYSISTTMDSDFTQGVAFNYRNKTISSFQCTIGYNGNKDAFPNTYYDWITIGY